MPQNLSLFSFQFSPPTARHYHPTLSIWLSVDPMADKYPSTSPYVYCGNNPVLIKDPNGTHGVVVLHQEQTKDIAWRGKVRSQIHLPATATLLMTYYYSSGTTQGSLSLEEITYIKDNIAQNLNPLVGQPISVNGNNYYFRYDIHYEAVENASETQLIHEAANAMYGDFFIGNYIWSGISNEEANGQDLYGVASDNFMKFDFQKIFTHAKCNQYDGQTAIHELMHDIGAKDIPNYGYRIMNWPDYTDPNNPKPRILEMNELEYIINNPHYQNRIHIINEP